MVPRVVCVHGLSGSPRWWRDVLPAFRERFDVEVLDLRKVAPVRGADWLAARLRDDDALVAHSLGALLAAQAAARRPLRALVLVAPAGVPTGRRRYVEPLALAATLPTIRPRFLPTLTLDALRWGPFALARGGLYAVGSDLREELTRITAPTLLVWGERDRLVPPRLAREWEAAIPDARTAVVSGAGHVPMVERPSAFLEVVLPFLEESEHDA